MRRHAIVFAALSAWALSNAAAAPAAPWHGTVETTYEYEMTDEDGIEETITEHGLVALRLPGTNETAYAKGPATGDMEYERVQTFNPPRSDGQGCPYATSTTTAGATGQVVAGDLDSMIEYEIVGPIDTGPDSPPNYQLFARDTSWLRDVGFTETLGTCSSSLRVTNWLGHFAGGGTFEEQTDGTIRGTWIETHGPTTIQGQTVTTRSETTVGLSRQNDTDLDCIPDLKELSDMFEVDPTGCIDPLLADNDKATLERVEKWEDYLASLLEAANAACELVEDPGPLCARKVGTILTIGAAVAGGVGLYAGHLAADPPDPNYAQEVVVTEPARIDVRPIHDVLPKGAASALQNWLNQQARIAATSRALLQAIERWQGAHQADDFLWTGRHIRSAGPLAADLGEFYRSAASMGRKVGQKLESTPLGGLRVSKREWDGVRDAILGGGGLADELRIELMDAGAEDQTVAMIFDRIVDGARPQQTLAGAFKARGLNAALTDAAKQMDDYAERVDVPPP